MVARGREPDEVAALGWEHVAELMAQRRRLILRDETDEDTALGAD